MKTLRSTVHCNYALEANLIPYELPMKTLNKILREEVMSLVSPQYIHKAGEFIAGVVALMYYGAGVVYKVCVLALGLLKSIVSYFFCTVTLKRTTNKTII